jgi:hypothetical protein
MYDVPPPSAIYREEQKHIENAPVELHIQHPEDVPIERDVAPFPSRRLLQNGNFRLLQSGDKRLLQSSPATFDARIPKVTKRS